MSAFRDLVQGVVARIVGALSCDRFGSAAGRQTQACADTAASAVGPGQAEYSEQDLRDQERELRILMSNWM